MNLGENIYKYRAQRNMSQSDLADALDVSRQSVSKWENNSAVPELDKLVKMCEIFGITLDELVNGVSPIPEATEDVNSSEKHSPTLREVFGVFLICFSVLLAGISLIVNDFSTEAGIYFALILATAGAACCWPSKLTVQIGIYALDIFFLLALAILSSPQSAGFLSLPFLVIFIIQTYQASKE